MPKVRVGSLPVTDPPQQFKTILTGREGLVLGGGYNKVVRLTGGGLRSEEKELHGRVEVEVDQ